MRIDVQCLESPFPSDVSAPFAGSVVLVQSELDQDMPGEVIDAYAGAAREGAVVRIEGAGHALRPGFERTMFKQLAVHFARNT